MLRNEREAYAALLEHLVGARDCMRSIGLMRSDERWIVTSRIFDQTKDHVDRLMHRALNGTPTSHLILPPH